MKMAIVISKFNEEITTGLLNSCVNILDTNNICYETFFVPGAFEIPLVAKMLAKTTQFDAIICLGAVIRGETPHFEYVSSVVANGVSKVSLDYDTPVIFGILTTDNDRQAQERKIVKGQEVAIAAIEMVQVLQDLQANK